MLEVKGLSKSYAGESALSDVSFTLNRGEVVALLGANGSGKTTTIQSICRLIEWDQGQISLDGESTQTSFRYQRKIGAVLGGSRNTNWRLTAKQNADYFARLRGFSGTEIRTRIDELHTKLGLDQHANKEVMKLSTGNKQKAALLCALSYAPDFVLLDEPTLGLDFTTVADLQSMIESQADQQQQGFLITSHDLNFIDKICSRVIVLDHGNLLFEGSIPELKSKLFAYELTLKLTHDTDYSKLTESFWAGRFSKSVKDGHLHIQYEAPEQSLAMMNYLHQESISPELLTIKPLSAETAYQALVEQKESL